MVIASAVIRFDAKCLSSIRFIRGGFHMRGLGVCWYLSAMISPRTLSTIYRRLAMPKSWLPISSHSVPGETTWVVTMRPEVTIVIIGGLCPNPSVVFLTTNALASVFQDASRSACVVGLLSGPAFQKGQWLGCRLEEVAVPPETFQAIRLPSGLCGDSGHECVG